MRYFLPGIDVVGGVSLLTVLSQFVNASDRALNGHSQWYNARIVPETVVYELASSTQFRESLNKHIIIRYSSIFLLEFI
jgi:hypothetical protein